VGLEGGIHLCLRLVPPEIDKKAKRENSSIGRFDVDWARKTK